MAQKETVSEYIFKYVSHFTKESLENAYGVLVKR